MTTCRRDQIANAVALASPRLGSVHGYRSGLAVFVNSTGKIGLVTRPDLHLYSEPRTNYRPPVTLRSAVCTTVSHNPNGAIGANGRGDQWKTTQKHTQ